ncbi:hypothetical protein OG612_41700 [Streptomyces sp. NBC_01527]|uniref:hypothetical protein n=1 Tax=Streptomyces sp. NBC_01527 TaxID=2903894 RepID=UPI00386D1E86
MRFAAEHGYSAYDVESLGLTGIAGSVSAAGEIHAALAVSGPEPRFSVETAESWLPELSAAAKRLEPWIESD